MAIVRSNVLRALALLWMATAAHPQSWKLAALEETTLEYRLTGARSDPTVILLHGGLFADGLEPLALELAKTTRLRVLTWHRVGYARSSAASGRAEIASQAAQLARLMNHLDLPSAHVIGHSSGGLIALQLVLDYPAQVRSLVLLEAALPVAGASNPGITQALQIYRSGDHAAAVDTFMQAVAGTDWRAPIERDNPQALEQAVIDAPSFFEQELPAVRNWRFNEMEASRIRVPVLAVLGARSPNVSTIWQQRQDFLMQHLPEAEAYVLPHATHMLAIDHPQLLARRLTEFFNRQR